MLILFQQIQEEFMNNVILEPSDEDLICYGNRALWGEVRPNMREIYIEYKKVEKQAFVYFYYDTQPTEEDQDYCVEGTILTELISNHPNIEWENKSFIIPYPQEIVSPGICLYRRFEKGNPLEGDENARKNLEVSIVNLIIASSYALLGEIKTYIRDIYFDFREEVKQIIVSFYYDILPTKEDSDSEDRILAKMSHFFEESVKFEKKSFYSPFPEFIPKEGRCIYSRYEKWSDVES